MLIRNFNFTLKKTGFFSINIRNKRKYLFLFHDWFVLEFAFTYFFNVVIIPNSKYLLELIKRRSKDREKNMSCECSINQWEFDQGLFTNLPTIIVTYNFSVSSFKLKKRYPTSIEKICILTWKLLAISS